MSSMKLTPTPGCGYCLTATQLIELDRQTIAKAMAKINQQAKTIAKLRQTLENIQCLGGNRADPVRYARQVRKMAKEAQENEG